MHAADENRKFAICIVVIFSVISIAMIIIISIIIIEFQLCLIFLVNKAEKQQ